MPARLKIQLTEVEEQELSKLTRHPKIPESRFEYQRMESSRNCRLAQTITKYNLEKQFLDGFFKAEKDDGMLPEVDEKELGKKRI